MYTGDSSVYTYTFPLEKNPECPVCGTVSITLNCSPEATLKELIQELIDKKQL
jgi:ubiquitin-activating enzyme E1 C